MRHYVRKEDTARLLLALGATMRHHEPARPWQSPAMERYCTPEYFEYDTPLGMVKVVRYDVATPLPIAPSGVPDGANVVIATTTKTAAMLASIPYLWTDTTTPPKPAAKLVAVDVIQSSLFDA